MEFLKWVKEFKKVNLPIGDLAKDILADPDFPKTNKRSEIYNYLSFTKNADARVLEVFEHVWKAYKSGGV